MEKHNAESKSGSFLIKRVKIISPDSVHHNRTKDILIADGKISEIGDLSTKDIAVIEGRNLIATPGLFDLRCRHGEPGLELKEDMDSLIQVAAAGGFTGLATLPDSKPCIQTRSQIEFLKRKTARQVVEVFPLGATTVDLEGDTLTEIFDMHLGGAIGFSNGDHPYNPGALQRALLYTKNVGNLVFTHAEDKSLSYGGFVNESEQTAALGLKYFAAHAEYTVVAREIEIARYTNNRLHFSHISTKQSVDLIEKAKAEGLPVSCDASILHLIYTDASLSEFDANLKIMPPLRSESDRLALIEGINKGTIDCIISDHNPHNAEEKLVEFNYSPFGAISLQILFSLYNIHLSKSISWDRFVMATSIVPRRLLKLPESQIVEGNLANLSVFDLDLEWEFNKHTNLSLSSNSHLLGETLKGKCVFTAKGNTYNIPN